MLYKRDFRFLTEQETTTWKKVEKQFDKSKINGKVTLSALNKYYNAIPPAALHYKSLFPNNYLNTDLLKEIKKIKRVKKQFKQLLDKNCNERDILNFIREQEAAFTIASLLPSFYRFGHHEAFAFQEFELPPNHKADYILVGKNSGGYEFVFVELEACCGKVTTAEGEFGSVIRKGIKQVNDWSAWLDANYSHLRLVYSKYLSTEQQLPTEFFQYDKSRIHFAVIAGRRNHFTQKTYHYRRKLQKENNILLLHYDNLLDCINWLIKAGNY